MSQSALAYIPKESWLHNLNPMTVVTYVLSITVLGLTVTQIWLLTILFFLSMIFVISAGVIRNFMYMFVRVTLPIVIPLFLVHAFFNPAGETILYRLGPLSIKLEGVLFASNILFRLLAILAAYFMMVLVVNPRRLMITLSDRGVSPKVGYLILSTLQLIPHIEQTAQRILDAQRSRGLSLKGNVFKRFKSYIPLMGPVVMGGFSTLEIRAMAMEVRGLNLNTKRNYIIEVPDKNIDKALRWIIIILSVVCFALSIYLKVAK